VNLVTTKERKWTALRAMVATMLAATTVFGEVPTPCWEAYLASGFTRQQMGFDEFRELHSDSECAQGGEGDQEQREFAHK
jgi:hypothetical protein